MQVCLITSHYPEELTMMDKTVNIKNVNHLIYNKAAIYLTFPNGTAQVLPAAYLAMVLHQFFDYQSYMNKKCEQYYS